MGCSLIDLDWPFYFIFMFCVRCSKQRENAIKLAKRKESIAEYKNVLSLVNGTQSRPSLREKERKEKMFLILGKR